MTSISAPAGPDLVDGETAARRDHTIDALRGAAIILMIVDHALGFAQTTALAEQWMHTVRITVTRLSMPAFMLCSGMLLARHQISRRRWCEVATAAVVVNLAAVAAGMSAFVPDILALWCVVMVVAGPIRRMPVAMAVLGLLQTLYWPIPIHNFQPGWVMAFVALGVLAERGQDRRMLQALGDRLPSWTEPMGRHPLGWYLGHLAVLASVTVTGGALSWW